MPLLDELERPTLLVNPDIARNNIHTLLEKARQQGVRLRPHFKTHQSAVVGEWFRETGVNTITTSSVEMAAYFVGHGWNDITIAFPVNLREIRSINVLASRIRLGLLVESSETVTFLHHQLQSPVDVWIKVDSGNGRTGIPWDQPDQVQALAQRISLNPVTRLRGLLTHAGHTYSAPTPEEIVQRYQTSVNRMLSLQSDLWTGGLGLLEVSVGDTPGCTLSPALGRVDEIRPGNFVFYDGQMLRLGVCTPQQVAVVLACPIVSRHPERGELVIYGGAVHLSKEIIKESDGSHFGYVVRLHADGRWSAPLANARVVRLSQEHGIIAVPAAEMDNFQVGDWLGILPAHSCLTVAAMGSYRTLDGQTIPTYRSAEPV